MADPAGQRRRDRRRQAQEASAADYLLCVTGPDGLGETAPLEVDTDLQAVRVAFLGCSTFGHSLWRGGRFLGHFEPGDRRIPLARRAPPQPLLENH